MISVCMATYNGEKYIKAQLESILIQLGADDEIIISDNYSTDSTIDIINSFSDSRIRLIEFPADKKLLKTRHGKLKNIGNNFENALRLCKGDYIFLSDQDDVWLNNKIERMMSYLGNYDLVMSNATTIDGNDNVLMEKLYLKNPLSRGKFSFRARGCLFGMSRKLLQTLLPIPKSINEHDQWMAIIAEFWNSYYFLDEPLILHRRNIGNASTDVSQKSQNSFFYKIYYRINLLTNAFIRLKIQKR